MGAIGRIKADTVMASRWRRRRMCILLAETPAPAALREVSARGAYLETGARPAIGSRVELNHPEAGTIAAAVEGHEQAGIRLRFTFGEASMAFAVAAITSDMTA